MEPVPPRFDCAIHPANLHLDQFRNQARIVVAVADCLQYKIDGDDREYWMEGGRQMAQACHAVSALKLRYIEEAIRYRAETDCLKLVIQMMENPITTIVVRARDTRELLHINHLAEQEERLHFMFADDNKRVYGTDERIPSAIAVGPLMPQQFTGITDYLPLWKEVKL